MLNLRSFTIRSRLNSLVVLFIAFVSCILILNNYQANKKELYSEVLSDMLIMDRDLKDLQILEINYIKNKTEENKSLIKNKFEEILNFKEERLEDLNLLEINNVDLTVN